MTLGSKRDANSFIFWMKVVCAFVPPLSLHRFLHQLVDIINTILMVFVSKYLKNLPKNIKISDFMHIFFLKKEDQ